MDGKPSFDAFWNGNALFEIPRRCVEAALVCITETHRIVFYFSRRIICLLNVHSHHGDHHHETNMTVKAAILHTAGDVLHSFAVLVGAILIKINVS